MLSRHLFSGFAATGTLYRSTGVILLHRKQGQSRFQWQRDNIVCGRHTISIDLPIIRQSVNKNIPYGRPRWVDVMVTTYHLESTTRPASWPKKPVLSYTKGSVAEVEKP